MGNENSVTVWEDEEEEDRCRRCGKKITRTRSVKIRKVKKKVCCHTCQGLGSVRLQHFFSSTDERCPECRGAGIEEKEEEVREVGVWVEKNPHFCGGGTPFDRLLQGLGQQLELLPNPTETGLIMNLGSV